MAGVSLAIISVIAVMDVMLLRTGKKPVVIISLPLMSVPVFYLLAMVFGAIIPIPVSADVLFPGMVVAGALVGIACCGVMTMFIKTRASKTVYFVVSAGYLAALTVAYLIRIMP